MAERVSLNVKTSPTLRQTCHESGLDRPCSAHGQGIREKSLLEGLGEVRCQANRIVEKTAKHWEIA